MQHTHKLYILSLNLKFFMIFFFFGWQPTHVRIKKLDVSPHHVKHTRVHTGRVASVKPSVKIYCTSVLVTYTV